MNQSVIYYGDFVLDVFCDQSVSMGVTIHWGQVPLQQYPVPVPPPGDDEDGLVPVFLHQWHQVEWVPDIEDTFDFSAGTKLTNMKGDLMWCVCQTDALLSDCISMVLLGSPLCLGTVTILWHQVTGVLRGTGSMTPNATTLKRFLFTFSSKCTVVKCTSGARPFQQLFYYLENH